VDGRGPPIYRRPPCLRHSGSQGQATSTNGHVEPFCSTYSVGTLFSRSVSPPALPRKRNPRWSPSQDSGSRHPESCLTIFGGAPGEGTLIVLSWASRPF
jgi:hypothetical protein